jgi:hypothetical protein
MTRRRRIPISAGIVAACITATIGVLALLPAIGLSGKVHAFTDIENCQATKELVREIERIGSEQIIVVNNSSVRVLTPEIALFVKRGPDAISGLLEVMKQQDTNFDVFVRCYSTCDQILRKSDPDMRAFWSGGCRIEIINGKERIIPRLSHHSQPEFRQSVIDDIQKKTMLIQKKH